MYRLIFSLVLTLTIIIISGCSSDSADKSSNKNEIVQSAESLGEDYPYYIYKEQLTFQDTIETMMNVAMERQRYHDNSGLYELELDYVLDEYPFDEYLKQQAISSELSVVVEKVEITSMERYDNDSVYADVEVFLIKQNGDRFSVKDYVVVYNQNNRWVKPTIGSMKNQIEYDEMIRKAQEAAEEEND